MLTFWALLEESDVEAFVGTLFLPSYMSYLRRAPLRFSEQPPNIDGRQPLTITYLGEGRIEEFAVYPEKHAFELLRSVCPRLDLNSVRISSQESIWNWSVENRLEIKPTSAELPQPFLMRLYFEPNNDSLAVDFPPRFDPRSCHISVSRRELLIGRSVLQAYCAAWIERLEGTECRTLPKLQTLSGGVVFQGERIGGEFLLEDDGPFRDLLRFTGLERALKDVAELVSLDLENAEIDVDDDGFRFRLVSAAD